jgi:hypothetical protein
MITRFLLLLFLAAQAASAAPTIPVPLQPWAEWVQEKIPFRHSPSSHANAAKRMPLWVSELSLDVSAVGGSFTMKAEAFDETWLTLPGDENFWPMTVQVGAAPVVVLGKNGPVTRLAAGSHVVTGKFQWSEMPERLALPREVGVVRLTIDGKDVAAPNWDEAGWLWLKRQKAETTDRDFMAAKIYRLLEDGQPMWLRTEVELSVAGKSREEDLGQILPEGWKIATVDSPLPTLVDEKGTARAQVRAGKWTIKLTAFRTEPQAEISYAANGKRLVESELVALKQAPGFRMIELLGVTALDASQTTFPKDWRAHPLYQWDNQKPFQVDEKMRGMGLERPAGLTVDRTLWLDDDGKAVTFQDRISGDGQSIWRLDAAPGQNLGAAKVDSQGQLITKNPNTGALGVEVRQPSFNVDSTGRTEIGSKMPAVGWLTNAQKLEGTLHLPPGWRLLALFGPDVVEGDWLTQWTLLDVFLLLVFTMAVGRMWGWLAGAVAFLAFILSYHEVGAPRWSWLWLVVVLGLIRVLPLKDLWLKRGKTLRLVALIFLAWRLVLFVQYQVTALLYPQLESLTDPGKMFSPMVVMSSSREYSRQSSADFLPSADQSEKKPSKLNMKYDKQVRIQTGPALPDWSWRKATFSWRGPVNMKQTMQPVLLSSGLQRALIVVRLALIGALLALMLRRKNTEAKVTPTPASKASAAVAMLAGGFLMMSVSDASAQNFPSPEMLKDLEERLNQADDAFPNAATIPTATIALKAGRITMQLELHAAQQVAVPLPGKPPAWSPVKVLLDNQPAVVKREEGVLWVVVPPGVHQCQVEGLAPAGSEWEWAFPLRPAHVTVDAPGWTVTGLRSTGVPEAQIFFVQQVANTEQTAAYDRRDFNPLVQITRQLELGLVWQVRTEVKRLTPNGKAISLSLPLLAGERLLTPGMTAQNGRLEARLGGQDASFAWESELEITPEIKLLAEKSDRWVEEWRLEASPAWNVSLSGLQPVFNQTHGTLVPVWQPWPGESAVLKLTQPVALAGETLTVRSLTQEVKWGKQQRTTTLTLELESSLGRDLPLDLPAGAEITSVNLGGQKVPARQVKDQWVVGIRPGKQTLEIQWILPKALKANDAVESLSLPVDMANAKISIALPRDRWVLWASGPQRGPAVRFWGVLLASLLFALLLGKFTKSPLKWWHWALLLTGMTQVATSATFMFVGWVLLLGWRGRSGAELSVIKFRFLQLLLLAGACSAAVTILWVLRNGLLGSPHMFIAGEGSTAFNLHWFQARGGKTPPTPEVISVSIWAFRTLMLIWALWLAWALLGWIRWAWDQFTTGGWWKSEPPHLRPPLYYRQVPPVIKVDETPAPDAPDT